jgi:hypothetical protein
MITYLRMPPPWHAVHGPRREGVLSRYPPADEHDRGRAEQQGEQQAGHSLDGLE